MFLIFLRLFYKSFKDKKGKTKEKKKISTPHAPDLQIL